MKILILFFFIERACAYFLVTNRPIVSLNAQCADKCKILKCKGSNCDRYTCEPRRLETYQDFLMKCLITSDCRIRPYIFLSIPRNVGNQTWKSSKILTLASCLKFMYRQCSLLILFSE